VAVYTVTQKRLKMVDNERYLSVTSRTGTEPECVMR